MSWTTTLYIDYFNKRMNARHDYRTEFFGDAQWKQAASVVDQIIKEDGAENVHSIYLDGHYCHWNLDDGTVLVPDECKCKECRPDLYVQPAARTGVSRSEALRVLLVEKKNNPDFVRFVSA